MRRKNTIDILQQDIEIPAVVLDKANAALKQIKMDAQKADHKVVPMRQERKSKKRYVALGLVAALAVGTVSVGAAYLQWSSGLKDELQISDAQQETLEENGMADFTEVSATDAGVTVTAQESITDNYYAYLSFKVTGYTPKDGEEPCFENYYVSVDGKDAFSSGGSFYAGTVTGEDGTVQNADGTPIQTNEDGSLSLQYVQEDGSLEYHLVLADSHEKGFFIGKNIQVRFENLGTTENAEYESGIEGIWELNWTLGGADTSQTIAAEEKLGDTSVTVTGVELSPVSIRVTYDAPREEVTEEYEDENGEMQTYSYYKEPPMPVGVKLKDGTILSNLYGGPGSLGYEDETETTYLCTFAFDRVIDPDQVAAVLFLKTDDSGEAVEVDGELQYYEVAFQSE